MFSFKDNNNGIEAIRPVAIVSDSKLLNNKKIYLHQRKKNEPIPDGFCTKIDLEHLLPNEKASLQFYPDDRANFTDRLTISGASGSGKSTLVSQMVLSCMKNLGLKSEDIFVCKKSEVKDPAWNKLGEINYIYINNDFAKNPVTLDDIAELDEEKMKKLKTKQEIYKIKAIIFDDLDTLTDKVAKVLKVFQNSCLEESRKYNIYIFICTHGLARGIYTKALLTESTLIGTMTHAISSDLKYALDKYQDVSKHLIRKLKNGDTRFFLLQTNYPKYILTQKELFIFDSDAESEMVDFEHKYKRPYNKVIRKRLNGISHNSDDDSEKDES